MKSISGRIKARFKRKPVVSVIRLEGAIGGGGRFNGRGLNDAAMAPVIEKAFHKGNPKAVALLINSPGGSPVQSSLIAARIRRLAEETETPVYAFCEDVAASGGYWLACAADEIYVDRSSIIGSIGVIMASFGFQDLLAKHGVERRVHTAGKNKSFADPFKAETPADVKKIKALQNDIHESFIEHVKQARGDKLSDKDLFTGDIWVGQKGVDVGLADGVGHLVPFMKGKFGEKTRFSVHGAKRGLFSRLGSQLTDTLTDSVEERALWARFGL